jgi:ParB family chromosome partitioning protein
MNKPRRRKVEREPTSQDDMISQLEQGSSVSEKSQRFLKDMQSKDADKKSEVHDEPLFNSGAFFDLVLMEYIRPQQDNPRYLPVKSSRSNKEVDELTLDDCVLCEKGILENRLNKRNPRYNEIDKEIDAIKTLADSIKSNGLIQPITVWRGNTSNFPIISGHRRFYAVCFLYGRMVKIKTKIYPEKPTNVNILRHVENFSRADLSASDGLRSYSGAIKDLESVLIGDITATKRKDIVTHQLGLSQTQYYRFEKAMEYYEALLPILDNGYISSLYTANNDIQKLDKNGGPEKVLQYLDYLSESSKYVEVDLYLSQNNIEKQITKPKRGREKQFISFPKIKVNQSQAIMRLLKEDITQVDTGIEWDTLDMSDPKALEDALSHVIKALCK